MEYGHNFSFPANAAVPQNFCFPPPPPVAMGWRPPFPPPPPSHVFPPIPFTHFHSPNTINAFHDSTNNMAPFCQDPDSIWINSWMKTLRVKDGKGNKPTVKVSSVKEKLCKVALEIKELEKLSKYLAVLKKSAPEDEWVLRCEVINTKKKDLESMLSELSEPAVERFVREVKKRSKKRAREKRKRESRREEVAESRLDRARKHAAIDSWLDKMKDQVERAKREEDIKREADLVLSEVRRRKGEAKRTLSLLNTLTKLRSARAHTLNARAQTVSQQDTNSFTEVIDKLKSYWIEQLKEYSVEEQGLKVMLGDAELERTDNQLTIKKKILHDWARTLFSTATIDKPSPFQPQNYQQLISTRRNWDRFVSCETNAVTSSIPVGWVIPVQPSSDRWANLLQS